MYWTMFAKDAQKSGSALYARISEGVVRDDELKAMAAGSRKGQPHAPMLLGAVKFLLIRGAQHRSGASIPVSMAELSRTGMIRFPRSAISVSPIARRSKP